MIWLRPCGLSLRNTKMSAMRTEQPFAALFANSCISSFLFLQNKISHHLPVGPPKNWPEGGCVWGLKRQLWWQPNAIHDLPLLLIRDAPLLGIESLRVWLIQEEFRRSGPECGPFINQRFNIVAFPRGAGWFCCQGENLVRFVVLLNYWYLF